MIKVYVAHPYRGNVENNVREVSQICRCVKKTPKILPISPIHTFSFYTEKDDANPEIHALILKYGIELLHSCDQLWLTGNWSASAGCIAEAFAAFEKGMPVFEFKFTKGDKLYVLKDLNYKTYQQRLAITSISN